MVGNQTMFADIDTMFEAEEVGNFLLGTLTQSHVSGFMKRNE